ncbi:AAA family ATPase [Candidatus Woesearchaeota archaeon]|nr:AAA family ATPase [Candidatus Woesearchaeota archaeon]
MIIGITGLARSGKDLVANYFVEKYKFIKLNMSDILRDELISKQLEPTKVNMSNLGNEWRKKYGADIIMIRVLEKAKSFKDIVITGIRSPEEIYFLKKNAKEVHIISIESSKELRFKRKNELDPNTKDKFFLRDENDMKNKGLDKAINLADRHIINDSTVHELFIKLDKLIKSLRHQQP